MPGPLLESRKISTAPLSTPNFHRCSFCFRSSPNGITISSLMSSISFLQRLERALRLVVDPTRSNRQRIAWGPVVKSRMLPKKWPHSKRTGPSSPDGKQVRTAKWLADRTCSARSNKGGSTWEIVVGPAPQPSWLQPAWLRAHASARFDYSCRTSQKHSRGLGPILMCFQVLKRDE